MIPYHQPVQGRQGFALVEIFLKDAKVSMITIMGPKGDFSLRKPAIGVFASLDELTLPVMEKGSEKEVAAFVITDIRPASNKQHDARVKVYFEAPNGEDKAVTQYGFTTEIHYLAVAMALGALSAPAGGLPIYFIDSNKYKMNSKFLATPDQIEFAVILPPKETEEGEDMSDKMAAMIHSDYAVPLAPVPWDQVVDSDEPSPLVRASQSKLLMLLLGLARGEVSPLIELMSYEDQIDMFEDDEEDDDEEMDDAALIKMEILSLCVKIAQHAYGRITTLNPELQTAAKGIDSVDTVDYNPQVDLVFSKLVNDPEVMGIFKDVKIAAKDKSEQEILREENIKTWNEPFSESWPEPMKPIADYIDTLEHSDIYHELVDIDFSDVELLAEKIDDYGLGKIFTSICISISSYALKKGTTVLNSSSVTVPAPLLLNAWTNTFEDGYIWELPALTESLTNYSFKNAVDVLTMYYEPAHDIEKAFYLWSVVHALGHHITASDDWDGYTPEKLAHDLDNLEINTQEFLDFKSWILRYFRKIKEIETEANSFGGADEHESDACAVSEAMHDFIDPDMNLEKMAEVVAMAFPVFADILALREGLEPGEEGWEANRKTYIYEMLSEIADEFGERIRLALR